MSFTGLSSFRLPRAGGPVPLAALLAAARTGSSAAQPPTRTAPAAAVPAAPPHPSHREAVAATGPAAGTAARQAGARPNKIGLFGMVSEECLERIRRHVEPIKGLHPWTAQAIYTALAVCASKQGSASVADGQRCRVTVAELAARTGMGRRNVERYLPVLRDAGVIRIVHAHDAQHRPVASHYLFVYPHTAERDTPTPESASPAAQGAESDAGATRESTPADTRVGTVSKSQENPPESGPEGANAFEGREGTNENVGAGTGPAAIANTAGLPAPVPSAHPDSLPADEEDDRWALARRRLEADVTPAAFGAWLRPLVWVRPGDAPAAGDNGAPGHLVLGCGSTFHRDQVERRYRAAIEAAVGGPVELVVLGPAAGGGPG
jgi:DNA-binding transcriptional ArsR family regulator